MKKIKSKILLGLGAMTTLVTTGSVVLSCGNSNSNKDKVDPIHQGLEGITADMVKTAITTVLKPADENPAPDAPKNNEFTNLSINGLDDVSIIVQDWGRDTTFGSVSFKITSISKDAESVPGDKLGSITISGFESQSYDQKLLNGVTKQMITDAITAVLNPATSKPVPDAPTLTGITINGLSGVTITVSNWAKDPAQGSVSFLIASLDKGLAHVDGTKFGTITIYGYNSTDQLKLDDVTTAMIANAINTLLAPDTTKQVPDAPIGNEYNDMTLNGVDGVSIRISNWEKQNWFGFLTFSVVSLNKGIAHVDGAKFGTIKVCGFGSLYTFSQTSGIEADSMNSAITKDGKYFVGTNKGLWVSNDGTAYTQASGGLQSTWNIISLCKTSNGNIYVGTGGNGLWVSTDTGITFTQVTGLAITNTITSIYQASNGDIYACTHGDGLFVLRAGGINFIMLNNYGWFINSILQTSIGDIFVATGAEGLWRSKDGGNDFTQVSGNLGSDWSFWSIYQTLDGNIYVGTFGSGLWVSKDGGSNFNQVTITSNGIQLNWEIPTIYQTSNKDIFVGTAKYGLWVSKDDGVNFTQVGGRIETNWGIDLLYQPFNVMKLFVGIHNQQHGLWVSNT